MFDPTEVARRQRLFEINEDAGEREELEKQYGEVWNTWSYSTQALAT